jgi:hypothetical protein
MPKVAAELKNLYSPDVPDLKEFRPNDDAFGILVQAMIGPRGSTGEESFDMTVCTPDWFAGQMNGRMMSGRHYLFVEQYDYAALRLYIEHFCRLCIADSWREVAEKLSRWGYWEFEDYQAEVKLR